MSLEKLNATLEERLQVVKSGDFRRINAAREGINAILYSAIKEHPLTINAVVISAMPDMSRECSDLPNTGNRGTLKSYLEAVGNQDLQGVAVVEFTEHLPFSLGRHVGGNLDGSSEYRNLEVAAFESKLLVPFGFRLDLSGGFLNNPANVYFLMEEVQGIRLAQVPDSQFSPRLMSRGQQRLFPSQTAADHYLFFKGFFYPERDSKLKDGSLYFSRYDDKLLRLKSNRYNADYDGIDRVSGFAVHRTDQGPVLYEFNNVMAQHLREPIAASEIIAAHQISPVEGVKTYTGHDIIVRLHEASKQQNLPKHL